MRATNRLIAILLGLALTGALLLAAIEIALARFDRDELTPWRERYHTLRMTTWDATSLDGAASFLVLLAAGFGFGLAIAPVNTVLLGVTGADVHGSASALAVVARTVGMLCGLSLLTAVALRRFERGFVAREPAFAFGRSLRGPATGECEQGEHDRECLFHCVGSVN